MICRIILSTISEILFPLTHVINFCIKDGIFPEQLKVSKVCPIYRIYPNIRRGFFPNSSKEKLGVVLNSNT